MRRELPISLLDRLEDSSVDLSNKSYLIFQLVSNSTTVAEIKIRKQSLQVAPLEILT